MKNNNNFIKEIYFDEDAATDYLNIKNKGKMDWSGEVNKEKLAKLIAEIDAEFNAKASFLTFIKGKISGKTTFNFDSETLNVFNKKISNTILTDYIDEAQKDSRIEIFKDESVYALDNSITMYRMVSSYLNIVPEDMMPIDLKEFNKALLGERGYYQMLLKSEFEAINVLRFNIKSFRNNYTLADLSKMNLIKPIL